MLFFLKHGYRVIAHDRRGHGRSTQTGGGHDMDHYADDLAALTAHLDLKASAMLSSKIVKGATLKVYPGLPHGMCSTHKDQINEDLLAFIKS